MSANSTLNELFGRYFHQDWVLDYGTWETAVDEFAAENPDDLNGIVMAIDSLLALRADDSEIEALLREAGCAYRDRSARSSYRDWLHHVLRRLQSHQVSVPLRPTSTTN